MRFPMDWFGFRRTEPHRSETMNAAITQTDGGDAVLFHRSLEALAAKLQDFSRHETGVPVRTASPHAASPVTPR